MTASTRLVLPASSPSLPRVAVASRAAAAAQTARERYEDAQAREAARAHGDRIAARRGGRCSATAHLTKRAQRHRARTRRWSAATRSAATPTTRCSTRPSSPTRCSRAFGRAERSRRRAFDCYRRGSSARVPDQLARAAATEPRWRGSTAGGVAPDGAPRDGAAPPASPAPAAPAALPATHRPLRARPAAGSARAHEHRAHGAARNRARHARRSIARWRYRRSARRPAARVLRSPGRRQPRRRLTRCGAALSDRRRAADSRRPPAEQHVRVVLDLEGVERHSVYTLYNPFRLVIDCEPTAPRPRRQPPTLPALRAAAAVAVPTVDRAPAVRRSHAPPRSPRRAA